MSASNEGGPLNEACEHRSNKHEERLALVIRAAIDHWRLIIGVPSLVGLFAILTLSIVPNKYTAVTRVLPPPSSSLGGSTIASQLGGGISGAVAGIGGIKNPSDLYVAMIKSRTISDALISKYKLLELYGTTYLSDARKVLDRHTVISVGKEGIITIEVEDLDPSRAASIANDYIAELNKLTQNVALTEASRRRLFFEKQFSDAKISLAKAEVAARKGLATGGLVKVDEQGRSLIEVTSRLRAQIAAKEVQISAMRAFAAEENPQLQVLMSELSALRTELGKSEGEFGEAEKSQPQTTTGMANLALLRDLKYQEALYDLLGKQYEIAKIDEAKEAPILQVLDPAIIPDKKSGPRRALYTLFAVGVSLALSLGYAIFLEWKTLRPANSGAV